jgi:hypothetical protein
VLLEDHPLRNRRSPRSQVQSRSLHDLRHRERGGVVDELAICPAAYSLGDGAVAVASRPTSGRGAPDDRRPVVAVRSPPATSSIRLGPDGDERFRVRGVHSYARTADRFGPAAGRGTTLIDRRRTPEYEVKRSRLSERLRLVLDLAEEAALADPIGPFRRMLADGTVVDLSSYDNDAVILMYADMPDGTRLFIDFDIS